MIEIPTEEEIFSRLISNYLAIAGPMNVDEGSISYDFLKPTAMEITETYRFIKALYYALWVDYAEGENLDLAVSVVGIERKLATKAVLKESKFKVVGMPGGIIEAGTRFMTEGVVPLFFIVPNMIELDENGVGWGVLEAEKEGFQGNIKAGTTLLPVMTINGLQSVELLADLEGGTDTESDDDLRDRYKIRVRRRATSGNAAHYLQWALEVPGVTAARIFENVDGPNTVRIVLLGQNGMPPDSTVVEAARAHILAQRPLGPGDDGIFVLAAVPKIFDFSSKVKLSKGYTLEEISELYQSAIKNYFTELVEDNAESKAEITIVRTKIGALLHGVRGVEDYDELTINGQAANQTVASHEIPVVGTVTLEVMT
jgi:uncharacterized phage protein gp47/JayE